MCCVDFDVQQVIARQLIRQFDQGVRWFDFIFWLEICVNDIFRKRAGVQELPPVAGVHNRDDPQLVNAVIRCIAVGRGCCVSAVSVRNSARWQRIDGQCDGMLFLFTPGNWRSVDQIQSSGPVIGGFVDLPFDLVISQKQAITPPC